MSKSIQSLRKHALSIFQAGIDAADPYQAVKECLTVFENHFEIALDFNDGSKKRCGRWTKIHLIGFGKAACRMVKAAAEVIPARRLAGKPLAITNYENVISLKNSEVIGAGHPIPDCSGQKAAERIKKILKKTESDELVLVLVSGGGSALIPSPAVGISLEDKQMTTDLLLASGADIWQINCVRKHLSQMKGGYLAKLATPADLHALILSDVIGDDPCTIASGPTEPDNTTFVDAVKILRERNIWHKVPENVQILLNKGAHGEIEETPKASDRFFNKTSHTLIGSNRISLKAMYNKAKRLGFETVIFSQNLAGEARDVAEGYVVYGKALSENNLTLPTAILAGGETTVTLTGTGKGGRNQEMALAFALAAEKQVLKGNWTFLSAGTDGCDGPTDAAGGIVDSGTLARIKKARINAKNRLNNNDSYSALKKSLDLVITGATGTNVADLQILLMEPLT